MFMPVGIGATFAIGRCSCPLLIGKRLLERFPMDLRRRP
jgi:hypothetical protein